MTNNAANPIVYVYGNKKIQGELRNLWRKLCKKSTENFHSHGGIFTITDPMVKRSPVFTPRVFRRKEVTENHHQEELKVKNGCLSSDNVVSTQGGNLSSDSVTVKSTDNMIEIVIPPNNHSHL